MNLRTFPQTDRTLTVDLYIINAEETLMAAMGEQVDTRQNIFFEQKVSCMVTAQVIRDFLKDALAVFGEIDTLLIDIFHQSDVIIQFAQEKSIKLIQLNSLNSHYPGFKGKIERYLKQRNSQINSTWRTAYPGILVSDNPQIRRGYVSPAYLNKFYSEGDQL